MNYLGGLLSNDAKVTSDLGRKIGEAMCTFWNLQRIWSHANLPIRKKLALFKNELFFADCTFYLNKKKMIEIYIKFIQLYIVNIFR